MSQPMSVGSATRLFNAALAACAIAFTIGFAPSIHAQALGWEGETGVFVTPLAYTASAEGQKLHRVVAYHYFNGGPVIGDFHEESIELGIGKRLEVGLHARIHAFGGDAGLSPLWQNGFEIFNGKAILIPENYRTKNWSRRYPWALWIVPTCAMSATMWKRRIVRRWAE